jgi:hypothetical protein
MHFDDNDYFKHFEDDLSKYKYLGLMAAVFIWFLLAIAGFFVRYPETSCHIIAFSFVISTIWIALHLIEISKDKNPNMTVRWVQNLRHKWIIVNMLYIILLELYALEADISFTSKRFIATHFDLAKWGFILLMIIVMAADHAISAKKPAIENKPNLL